MWGIRLPRPDLPMAVGILGADGSIAPERLKDYMLIGELGLDGKIKPVRAVLPIAIRARKEKFKGLIVPKDNVREAAVVNNLEVYGMDNLSDVIMFLNGRTDGYEPMVVDTRKEFYERQYSYDLDFADVKGQEAVKRALEVAAAGSHNIILIGPPGSGKSMMAKRLPSILPPLSLAESLETTQIHSVAGKLAGNVSLISQRPFRSPHHTVSQVAMTGGTNKAMPGEVSLAHNGILFLDELPEFSKQTLEVLRQPLEDRKITISRASYSVEYPCSFMFVASMNPCPCGYYGDPTHRCVCTPGQIQRYMSRISGPLLDRIDLHWLPFFPPVGGTEGGYPLQCADDGAHDPPVCRARCRLVGYAPHGYGEAEALCPRLQPHPQGGPHHCRPRRLGESAGHAHRRSYRV